MPKTQDPEMAAIEAALLRSVEQAVSGVPARVHTPEQIARRRAGRPPGSIKTEPKIPTTIRLSANVMQAFKATGKGWQSRIDDALNDWLKTHSPA